MKWREDVIAERVEYAIKEHVFPGCVIAVVDRDGVGTVLPFGHHTYQEHAHTVSTDTVYDLASITKSIPVASLAALFIEDGKMSLDDRVTKYIAELKNDYDACIEDLLRYRVQGPRLSTLGYPTFEQVRTHIFEHGFLHAPGSAEYSNVPTYLLGVILERVSGQSIHALAHNTFFEPLAMHDTTFFPDAGQCAPTEVDSDGAEILGLVHDESARLFAQARRSAGHAGLFSTAPDLLKILGTFLTDSSLLARIGDYAEQGLGWEVAAKWMGNGVSSKTFGKTGFTGTCVAIDRERGIAFTILSNRTYPHRPKDSSAIQTFRASIAELLLK